MPPSVTVIVVTYNSADVIRLCLKALAAQTYPRFEVIVVDNASSDSTRTIIKTEFPDVTALSNGNNRGFAAANNQAMRQASSDYIALINPDVELAPNWITEAAACLDAHAEIGIVGSKVFYSNRIVLQHVGGVIQANALTSHSGEGEFDIGQYEDVRDVDYVIGAALLVRREVAAALGYLDERYFLYFEETDFCVRARDLGYRVVYCPRAVAVHHETHSFSGTPSRRFLQRYHRSRLQFVYQNYSREAFLHQFVPAERQWMRQNVRGQHRIIVLTTYLTTLPDLVSCLLRKSSAENERTTDRR